MPTVIKHRGINIVTLQPDEVLSEHCSAGDIAIVQDETGWWTKFIDENGEIESYDTAFESYNKALWTAKAAAEFAAE